MSFDTAADPVIEAKVGISYVSVANAVLNRTTENPGWNFNAVKAAAHRSWQTMLDKSRGGRGHRQPNRPSSTRPCTTRFSIPASSAT